MTTHSMFMPEQLYNYMIDVGCRELEVLRQLRAETAALPQAHYQIAPDEGQLITFLLELIGARRTIDIGTFTGYSALAAALALPGDGEVITFDVSPTFTAVAWRYWHAAGVDHKIHQRLGPAIDGLKALIAAGEEGRFDFAFIDADKEGYDDYYEQALRLLRRGGLVALDNTLWRGRVADPENVNPKTLAFRAFNTKLHDDARVTPVMLPMGDGVTLARKRA